eukprot:g12925.t1
MGRLSREWEEELKWFATGRCCLSRTERDKRQYVLVANHFNSSSHSLDDMSILAFLQRHNDATWKLEEQHLIFRLGSLPPN